MRYISLREEEVLTLQDGQRHHCNSVFRQRCTCLLLSHQGLCITQLAKLYQTRTHSIRSWFDRYEQWASWACVSCQVVVVKRYYKPLTSPL